MKYPPRKMQHPEVIASDELWARVFGTLMRTYDEVGQEPRNSGQIQQVLDAILGRIDGDTAYSSMAYAVLKWMRRGRPIYYLEEQLARALADTELPFETFELPVWLPDDGMWVAVPPLFDVENVDTGMHRVEGFYLTLDSVAVPLDAEGRPMLRPRDFNDGPPKSKVVEIVAGRHVELDAITCVGVGEPRKHPGEPAMIRDDALVVFHLVPGMPLGDEAKALGGIAELTRMVTNLLYAMRRTTSVERELRECELPRKAARRRAGRAERLLAQGGKTIAPYTVLRLSSRVRPPRVPSALLPGTELGARKLQHPRLVPGHFHRYWVLDPRNEHVLETKPGVGGTLHLIEYLLAPYVQGAGLPQKNEKTIVVRR